MVCPTHSAQPARLSFRTISPRNPSPETACTERKNSGWWQISRSMPPAIAWSITAMDGSAANAMLRTSWRRSPTMSPGSSHCSAYRSGYSVSSTSTTCFSVATIFLLSFLISLRLSDGNGSVGRQLPIGTDARRYVQRNGHGDGMLHGILHQRGGLLLLTGRDLHHKFIMNLQYEATSKVRFLQRRVRPRPSRHGSAI